MRKTLLAALKNNWLLLTIVFLGLCLRLFNLGSIPGQTFDEVFYPVFGLKYILGEPFFSVHPPVGTYFISLSIYLYHILPWTEPLLSSGIGISDLNPISYRWLNAIAGTFIIYVAYRLCMELFSKKHLALLAALFFALDGSLLVDSRFGLINVYLSLFGLLSVLFLLQYFKGRGNLTFLFVGCLMLGLTFSIKWNGLGFWLMSLLFILLILYLKKQFKIKQQDLFFSQDRKFGTNFLSLLFIPFLGYLLFWLPDLFFNGSDIAGRHSQMISYHTDNVELKLHPYSSSWFTWPIMFRPIAYYFSSQEVISASGESLTMFNAVHLFPNPALTLLSLIAIFILSLNWLSSFSKVISSKTYNSDFVSTTFILLGYYTNFLPWALVSRSAFIYHYQASACFSFIALAYLLYKISLKEKAEYKALYILSITLIIAATIYWLPIQLGLDISAENFQSKMWLDSWI